MKIPSRAVRPRGTHSRRERNRRHRPANARARQPARRAASVACHPSTTSPASPSHPVATASSIGAMCSCAAVRLIATNGTPTITPPAATRLLPRPGNSRTAAPVTSGNTSPAKWKCTAVSNTMSSLNPSGRKPIRSAASQPPLIAGSNSAATRHAFAHVNVNARRPSRLPDPPRALRSTPASASRQSMSARGRAPRRSASTPR